MTPAQPTLSAPVGDCWNRIGISGDRSCPELIAFIHCRNCPVFASAARTFFDRDAPEDYLAEWAGLLAGPQTNAPAEAESTSVVIFRLCDEWLALATKIVVEVTAVRPVHRIPHRSNAIVAGLTNLRGQLYLCASLHGLLGLPAPAAGEAHGDRPRMIVIRLGHESWVFPAEEVLGVQRVTRDQLRAVPSTLANPAISFSQAVIVSDGKSIGFLDEQRVFSGLRSLGGGQ
jgi:chemotaxis-related protein WspD